MRNAPKNIPVEWSAETVFNWSHQSSNLWPEAKLNAIKNYAYKILFYALDVIFKLNDMSRIKWIKLNISSKLITISCLIEWKIWYCYDVVSLDWLKSIDIFAKRINLRRREACMIIIVLFDDYVSVDCHKWFQFHGGRIHQIIVKKANVTCY